MTGSYLGFVVEALVAVLLVVTIAYCLVVNRKLEQLRSDQSDMRVVIRDLSAATGQAENAIASLRAAAGTAEETLAVRIDDAVALESRLSAAVASGEELLSKWSTAQTLSQRRAPPRSASPSGHARSELRASQVGLGLLNARRRAAATEPDDTQGLAS